eukprot:7441914-Pyramimonas_sp.AAC.1
MAQLLQHWGATYVVNTRPANIWKATHQNKGSKPRSIALDCGRPSSHCISCPHAYGTRPRPPVP